MARKKRSKKRTARKVVRRASGSKSSKLNNIKSRIGLVVKNLLLFVALSLVSLVLYKYIPQNDILTNLFLIMTMIFGFVAVGFLITLLILVIIKSISKKR